MPSAEKDSVRLIISCNCPARAAFTMYPCLDASLATRIHKLCSRSGVA